MNYECARVIHFFVGIRLLGPLIRTIVVKSDTILSLPLFHTQYSSSIDRAIRIHESGVDALECRLKNISLKTVCSRSRDKNAKFYGLWVVRITTHGRSHQKAIPTHYASSLYNIVWNPYLLPVLLRGLEMKITWKWDNLNSRTTVFSHNVLIVRIQYKQSGIKKNGT